MKTLRVLRELTWAQRWTLAVALVLLPAYAARLRRSSPARVIPTSGAGGLASQEALVDAQAAARAVDLVAARLQATCLTRSLVLQRILANRGIAGVLRVGVSREGDALSAHAWVECGGIPVNDTAERVRRLATVKLP